VEEWDVPDPRESELRLPIEIFVLVTVRLYRDGIADSLGSDARFRVVGSAASLDEARQQLGRLERPPNAALVDVGVPEGADAARAVLSAWPETNVVALAVQDIDEDVVLWAEAGVSGLVSWDATLPELLDTVEAAASGNAITSPTVTAALLRRVAALAGTSAPESQRALTRREREIVRLIGGGLSNKEIACELRIELPTVKNHVHNILEKLRVGSRRDVVAAARSRGELTRV
jgi:two-component system nitrate/nitrite response regulator NarL